MKKQRRRISDSGENEDNPRGVGPRFLATVLLELALRVDVSCDDQRQQVREQGCAYEMESGAGQWVSDNDLAGSDSAGSTADPEFGGTAQRDRRCRQRVLGKTARLVAFPWQK